MNKELLINKITLLDTSSYRRVGLLDSGKFTKEPLRYRSKLMEIYRNLDIKDLEKLLELKK